MVAQPGQRERLSLASFERGGDALRLLAGVGDALASAQSLVEALNAIASAAAAAVRAEVVVIRVPDQGRRELVAAAVASVSSAVAAELEGTSFPLDDLLEKEIDVLERVPAA